MGREVVAGPPECNAAGALAQRLDALATQLDQVNPDARGPKERRAVKRLMTSLRRVAGRSQ